MFARRIEMVCLCRHGRRPGVVGIAQSHAILGIGPDIFDLFDDDEKSDLHHPRPGSEEFSAQAARTVGITTSDAGPQWRRSAAFQKVLAVAAT